jgi:hypothetical protein
MVCVVTAIGVDHHAGFIEESGIIIRERVDVGVTDPFEEFRLAMDLHSVVF